MRALVWGLVALTGAYAVGVLAVFRGESVNAIWFVIAAVCVYAVGYRFYSSFIAAQVLALDETRLTPAERINDGRDFVPTNRWVVFGHHFAAIAGPGPLIGPTLAAQFGYLPGTLWILAGVASRRFSGMGDWVLPALVAGTILSLAGAVWIALASRVVRARRIENGVLRLKGAGQPFLDSLRT